MKSSEILDSGSYTTLNSEVADGILSINIRDDKGNKTGFMKVKVQGGKWLKVIEDDDVKEW